MISLSSGYGLILWTFLLAAAFGFVVARERFEARKNEDDLAPNENLPPMKLKQYRQEQLQWILFFPAELLSFLQILNVTFDKAPGTVSTAADLVARVTISFTCFMFVFFSVRQKIRFGNRVRSHWAFDLRFIFASLFLILGGLYPWVTSKSVWYRYEMIALSVVLIGAIFSGLYIKRKNLAP